MVFLCKLTNFKTGGTLRHVHTAVLSCSVAGSCVDSGCYFLGGKNFRIFSTKSVFVRSNVMSTKQGSLSPQAFRRLQGGELILKGYDNETISDIVGVSISSVNNWRTILNEHNDDLCALVRKTGSGRPPSLNESQKQQLKQILLDGAVAVGYAERSCRREIFCQCLLGL